MTVKNLLKRLEQIKDSLSDCDGMERYGIEGTMDDLSLLMDDVDSFGVDEDKLADDVPVYSHFIFTKEEMEKMHEQNIKDGIY